MKCIYIDPPYNTGNEGWVYNDNVNSPVIRLEQQQDLRQSFRAHFDQVVLQPKLEEALHTINPFLRDD